MILLFVARYFAYLFACLFVYVFVAITIVFALIFYVDVSLSLLCSVAIVLVGFCIVFG